LKRSSPKLPLTYEERVRLRESRVKITEITLMNPLELSNVLGSTLERAQVLCALASFQTIPSIGPRSAQWMLDLGYYSLDDIKGENASDLTNRLEELYGHWMDPCVEDALRCIVYHANHPNSEKCWFDFTEERKAYRAQNGYPTTRPSVAWYEINK